MHVIAAKAVSFGEALTPEFKEYQRRIVDNAKTLADGLLDEGFNLVSGGTDNHLMLCDLRPFDVTGKEFEHRLDDVLITVNKNAIPNDPQSPFITSGVRIGTPAHLIGLAAKDFDNSREHIREEVKKLCAAHPIY